MRVQQVTSCFFTRAPQKEQNYGLQQIPRALFRGQSTIAARMRMPLSDGYGVLKGPISKYYRDDPNDYVKYYQVT